MKQISQNIIKCIKKYYIHRLYSFINEHDRGIKVSLIILLIRTGFLMMINLNQSIIVELSNEYSYLQNVMKFAEDMESLREQPAIQIGMLTLNCILLIQLIVDILAYTFDYASVKQFYSNFGYVYSFLSALFKFYNYIIFIPSVVISLSGTINAIRILNLVFTTLIALIVEFSDYNILFNPRDILARRVFQMIPFELGFEMISIILLINLDTSRVASLWNGIYHLCALTKQYYLMPYINFNMLSLICTIHSINFIFSILLFALQSYLNLFVAFFMVLLPFSIMIALLICKKRQQKCIEFYIHQNLQQICRKEQAKVSVKQNRNYTIPNSVVNQDLDVYLRILNSQTKLYYDEYTSSHNSIILESIINIHSFHCQDAPICFCSRGNNVETDGKLFLGKEFRQEHIHNYSQRMFNSYNIERWKSVDLINISYYAYLIEVMQNQTLSLSEIIKSKMNKNAKVSFRSKQALQYLLNHANSVFKISKLSHSQKLKKAHNNNNNNFNSDNNDVACNLQGINLYQVCVFDEIYSQILNELKVTLNIKFQMLNLLGKDHVNLEQLQMIANQLAVKQNQLRDQLINVMKQYKNTKVSNLCDLFSSTLSNDDKLHPKVVRGNMNRELSLIQQHFIQDQDSCVIFVSLLSNFGEIVKVSNNFEEVVQCALNNQSAIGKNINIILPKSLGDIHTHILEEFTRRKRVHDSIKHFPVQIGCDSQGWAIGYSVNLQLHQVVNKEVGVCALIKNVKNVNPSSLYLSLQIDELNNKSNVICLSQEIFTEILQDAFPQSQVAGLDFAILSPTLNSFLQDTAYNSTFFSTVFIKPKSLHQAKSGVLNFQTNQNYFIDIFENSIFQAKIHFRRYTNKFISLAQIEIQQLKQLTDPTEKIHYLSLLHHQFSQFKITKPIQSFEKLQQQLLGQDYNSQSIFNLYPPSSQSSSSQNKKGEDDEDNFNQLFKGDQYVEEEDEIVYSPSNRNKRKLKTSHFSMDKRKSGMSQAKQRNNQVSNEIKLPFQMINQLDSSSQIDSRNQINLIDLQSYTSRNNFTSALNLNQNNISQTDLNKLLPNEEQLQEISALNYTHQRDSTYVNIKSPANLTSATSFIQQDLTNRSQTFNKIKLEDISPQKMQSKKAVETFSSKNQLSSLAQYFSGDTSTHQKKDKNFKGRNQKLKNDKSVHQMEREGSVHSSQTSSSQSKYFVYLQYILFPLLIIVDYFSLIQLFSYLITFFSTNLKFNQFFMQSNRKDVLQMIKSQKKILGLILINMLGLMSILAIFLISLVNFIELRNFLSVQKTSFVSINWSSDIRTSMSTIFSNYYLAALIQLQVFNFQSQSAKLNLQNQAFENILQKLDQTKQLLSNFTDGDKDKILIFQKVLDQNIEYAIPISALVNKTMPVNLSYGLLLQSSYLQTLRNPKYIDYLSLLTAHINFQMFESELFDIQEDVYSQYGTLLHERLDKVEVEMIIVLTITLFFVIGLIPIYMFVQFKKEKLLTLMTTIPPEKIKFMMSKVYKGQYKLDQIINSSKIKNNSNDNKQQSNHLHKQQTLNLINNIEKRKNQSTTSKIKKIDLRFFVISFIFFSLLQIYTITTFFTLKVFERNSVDNQRFMNDLAELKHFIQLQMGNNYLTIVARVYPNAFILDPQAYLNLSKELNKESSLHLTKLYTFENNFNTYQHHNQNQFDEYLIPVLQSKACDVIDQNRQYQSNEMKFDYIKCKAIQNGIFQSGLIASLKLYFTNQNVLIEIFTIDQVSMLIKQLKEFQEHTTVIDLYDQTEYSCKLIEYLMNFMNSETLILFDNIEKVHIVLIMIQSLCLFISLYFGWFKFYILIEKQLMETKQLLNVIDADIILENSYIISYLKQNK